MKTPTREDYELAAKAAGIVLDGLASAHIVQGVRPDDYLILNDKGGHSVWNPLYDDGDSRRLQVACGIDMFWWNDTIEAQIPIKEDEFGVRQSLASYADHNNDKYEAARHAVFFLAVAIGRVMP